MITSAAIAGFTGASDLDAYYSKFRNSSEPEELEEGERILAKRVHNLGGKPSTSMLYIYTLCINVDSEEADEEPKRN